MARFALGSPRLALAMHLGRPPSLTRGLQKEPSGGNVPEAAEGHATEPLRDAELLLSMGESPGPMMGVEKGDMADKIGTEAVRSMADMLAEELPLAQWCVSCGWDEERHKQAPAAAKKYRNLCPFLAALLQHWAASIVVLHEPGFHWVRPALLQRQHAWQVWCHVAGNPLQRRELLKSGLPQAQIGA